MPAGYIANPLPYISRELLGKLRVICCVSPLTYAFEEGQAAALGQQPRRAEPFGFEGDERASGRSVVRVDRNRRRAEQRTQAAARCALDHDDTAARRERAKSLLQCRDPLLWPHRRQQA